MDKSIYDYRGKGVYTVAGRKNLKLLSLPTDRRVHKEAPSLNNTNFQERHTHGKLKRLKKSPIHGTFGSVFNIKIILFRFYSIHKHNLNLILDDHVKKEIKKTPYPDRMLRRNP